MKGTPRMKYVVFVILVSSSLVANTMQSFSNLRVVDFNHENQLGGTVGTSCPEDSLAPSNLAIDDSDSTLWSDTTCGIEPELRWFYEFAEAKKITKIVIKYWTLSTKWNIEILAESKGGMNTIGLYSLPSSFQSEEASSEPREASIYFRPSSVYERYILKYVNKDPNGGNGFGLYNVQMFEEVPIKERIQTAVGEVKTLVEGVKKKLDKATSKGSVRLRKANGDYITSLIGATSRLNSDNTAQVPIEERILTAIGEVKTLVEGVKETLDEATSEGSVRLRKADGDYITSLIGATSQLNSDYTGRLEVKIGGRWGTVCTNHDDLIQRDRIGVRKTPQYRDNVFNMTLAMVVCGMLGSESGGFVYGKLQGKRAGETGQLTGGTGFIALRDLLCHGSETSLLNCPRRNFDQNRQRCGHQYDLTVSCARA